MAKQDGATEKATPRRREKAREQGDIPRSKELGLSFGLLSLVILIWSGNWFVAECQELFVYAMEMMATGMDPATYLLEVGKKGFEMVLVVATVVLAAASINHVIQVQFLFTAKALKPNFKRMGFGEYKNKVWGRRPIVEIVKQTLIMLFLGYVVYLVFRDDVHTIIGTLMLPWNQSVILLWGLMKEVVIKITVAFVVVSAFDYAYQRWEHEEKLKMKREDVKREYKESEGSPEVKGKQRREMLAILEREVTQKMGDATILAVNPTHYAVAIRYNSEEGNPRVILKGMDYLALFMKDLAKEKDIPIVENPPFTRELYQRAVENEEVPHDMWGVLAKILEELRNANKIKL